MPQVRKLNLRICGKIYFKPPGKDQFKFNTFPLGYFTL
jgi:hypothetical protein